MILFATTLNIFFTAYSQSDIFGKCIFLGLFSLSILCWVVLIHRVWITKKVRGLSELFKATIEKNRSDLLRLDIAHLPAPTYRDLPHPFGHIFQTVKEKTIELLEKNRYFSSQKRENSPVHLSTQDIELLESQMLTAISSQTKLLEKNLFILSMIITLAPFLGLLGTVWGILITFSELHAGASATSNSAVLGGLATALSTTVLGLVIAIPALVSYSYLKNATKALSSTMEDFSYELLATIELQYRRSE